MFNIFKSVINSKNYELTDMLKKINNNWIIGNITDEQKEQLTELAREYANPINSYAPETIQIEQIREQLKTIEQQVNENTRLINELLGEKPDEPKEDIEEYPEFKQPTGAHDSYKNGDKVTFEGKKYVCNMDNCVWSPTVYPNAWLLEE